MTDSNRGTFNALMESRQIISSAKDIFIYLKTLKFLNKMPSAILYLW
ncbi:MAG: hypothetical protein [Olavius algarvensis Delta 4 endosymbiont]|nr:MAG: hypothetical protein [Olavius algarvensis Delta 4 endosymbiont]